MTSPTYTTDGGSSPLSLPPNTLDFPNRKPAPKHAGDDNPWEVGTLGEPGSAVYDMGLVLFDVLNLPGTAGAGADGQWGTADDTTGVGPDDVFTWSLDDTGRQGRATQMTLAGALSWLRNLSSTNRDEYNYIIDKLVQAQYITPDQARYNTYTNDMAAAFLQSVIDVYFVNQDEGAGATTTWFNHIDALAEGAQASGQAGSGSGGLQPPVRQDRFTDEATVRDTVRTAARNALGRDLTDSEAEAFIQSFRGLETQWNNEVFAGQMADYSGQASAVHTPPVPGVAADNFIDEQHGQEADAQSFGSFMGVLRNMVGLGAGGIGGNVG